MAYQENIPTLLYSPSITVYVGHKTGFGEYEYLDVSDDVTSCNVSRNENSCSTFSFSLLNNNGKYNGKFEPMDLCTIYAQKEGRITRLITGYITDVPRFTLFPGEFDVSGFCSLYRLQRLWWDPHLNSSWSVFMGEQWSKSGEWNGYQQVLFDLLTKVGGLSADDIRIGDLPPEVEDWARRMWEVQQGDMAQLVSQMDEFYDILMTTGITGGGGGAAPGGGGGSTPGEATGGEGTLFWIDPNDYLLSRDEFIAKWEPIVQARANEYGGGDRPLAKQVKTMVAYAYDYKLDPRLCWAVGVTESGAGQDCIKPYNAWGWGAADDDPYGKAKGWTSWDQAIKAWSAGVQKGYSKFKTIEEVGNTYCSSSDWGSKVWNEMEKIAKSFSNSAGSIPGGSNAVSASGPLLEKVVQIAVANKDSGKGKGSAKANAFNNEICGYLGVEHPSGDPECSKFVMWCFCQALGNDKEAAKKALRIDSFNYVSSGLYKKFESANAIVKKGEAKPGYVFFRSDHAHSGIVVSADNGNVKVVSGGYSTKYEKQSNVDAAGARFGAPLT